MRGVVPFSQFLFSEPCLFRFSSDNTTRTIFLVRHFSEPQFAGRGLLVATRLHAIADLLGSRAY